MKTARNVLNRVFPVWLLVIMPLSAGAQRVLSLDSCRQLAIANNKQLSVARTNKEIAAYNVKSARTKYLPHVDALAGYELMSKEVSILNNSQKDALNNLGTNVMSKLGSTASDVFTKLVQDGAITPQMAQQLGEQLGTVSSSLAAIGDEFGSTIRKAFRTNNRNMFAGSVMVNQPLYMGGSITALNRIAEINETIADECVLVGLYGTVVCHFIADKHIAVLANSNVVDACCLSCAGEPDKG